ncbi:MAG: rhomboid family intramembrane serine protease [Nitrospinae bacterium]|nr:rhomboid family intramembrane serine protease [Nitrospinota bacterium]
MAKIFQEEGRLAVEVRSAREARDYELLFLSRKIPFSLEKGPPVWTLVIPEAFAGKAQKEIGLFQKENPRRRYPHKKGVHDVCRFPYVNEIVLLCLALFHWIAAGPGASPSWVEKGRASASDILSGEWTRSVTALTLHGDYTHLIGNLAALWLFVNEEGYYVGSGMAWLLVLLSGSLGNMMSACFYGGNHFSIGASTSVFGAVGILGGMKAVKGFHELQSWKRKIIPIGAALALLAMLGADPESDVMSHLFGLIAGLGTGLLTASFFPGKAAGRPAFQWLALAAFCGAVFLCWMDRLK